MYMFTVIMYHMYDKQINRNKKLQEVKLAKYIQKKKKYIKYALKKKSIFM